MTLQISHPIAIAIYNYFTNFNESYTRKKYAFIMLILSSLLISVYYFGTDFETLKTLQTDLNQEISSMSSVESMNQQQALENLMEDEEFVKGFSEKVTNSIPSMFWVCFIMLISIPAIIKRTNDTFISRSHSYPVVIYYVLYFFQSLTGLYFNFLQINTVLSLYATIFVLLISVIPTKTEQPKEY